MKEIKDFANSLTEEQKELLLQILNEEKEVEKEADEKINVSDNFIVTNNKFGSNQRKQPVKARKNTWTDTGESRDIKTPEVERTPRRRKAPEKIKIACHVCGRKMELDKRFVYGEYHRCDNCTGNR